MMNVLAKPSGITLREHTANVQRQADGENGILATWPFLAKKYAELSKGGNLAVILKKSIRWHDAGKRCKLWQDACQQDFAAYQQWRERNHRSSPIISAQLYRDYESFNYQTAGQHLKKSGFRHEFGSLILANDEGANLSFIEQVAIAAHHGKLGRRHAKRWNKDGDGIFIPYWGQFLWNDLDTLRDDPDRWEKLLLARYEIAAVRALLQLADTRASREEAEGKLAPLTRFEYEFPHGKGNERGVQKAALELAGQWVSILRAPTGSGKTDAALLWGKWQVENGRADRLIIAMPTRFTSNALSLNIKETVSDTGLYHSSAWFTRFGKLTGTEKNNARELQRLAQLLATPVTVCTVDHLLISLTGAAEHHHSSFFFLANSAVVFDEADFYDPFVQANLTVLLKALRVLRVPVLIMSATVPDSARELYGVSDAIKEPTFNETPPERSLAWAGKRMGVGEYGQLPTTEKAGDVADVLQKMADAGHGIVYANTVERALMYYDWFAKNSPESGIILYHSRYTEPDKKIIEEKLLAALGRKVWDKEVPEPRGIAILTQIGEMSINISSSIMLSDLCPWDRLAQRLGRLNRFAKSDNAVAHITVPYRREDIYVAPYGTLVERKWVPAAAFTNTLTSALKMFAESGTVPITPKELVDAVNALYPDLPAFPDKAADNRDQLYNLMSQNWLIVPDRRLDEEAGTVSVAWRSRDIDEHRTVFTRAPEDFKKYEDYQAFALEYGVSCPIWMVERELRKDENQRRIIAVKRWIDDEEETLLYTDKYESWDDGADQSNVEGSLFEHKSKRGMAFLYDKSKIVADYDDPY